MSITDDDFLQLTPTPVPVLNLVQGQYEQSVTVRLLRSWEVRNFKQKGALMSLDMLFLDSKDTMVQASIYHRRIQLYKSKLKEGKVYNLSNFEVVPSYSHYKITDHKFIIRFTDSTEINEVPCDEIPTINTEKFRLHNWREIEVLADTNLKLIDIVGQLLHVQGSNLEDDSSTQKIVLLIFLQKNISLQVMLWDNQASAFRRIFHQTARKSSVIVITCLNPKKFAGKLQLSSTGSTKFYVDYNLEAVKEFMGRMGIQNNVAEASVAEAKSISKNYERWTISQIFDFIADGNEQEKEVICEAKITDISTRNGWSYLSCATCSKKLERSQSSLLCKVCNEDNTIGIVRFRVELVVESGIRTTTFVLFDKDVRKITNTTAEEIASAQFKDEKGIGSEIISTTHSIPECLLRLIGKTMDFQVKITEFNFKTSFQTFTVSRIVKQEPEKLPQLMSPDKKVETGKLDDDESKRQDLIQLKKEKDDDAKEEENQH